MISCVPLGLMFEETRMDNIEATIDRVRAALGIGIAPADLPSIMADIPPEILFLAYHAAVILDADEYER